MTPTETLTLVQRWRHELGTRLAEFDAQADDAQALTINHAETDRFFRSARELRIAAGQLEEATRTHLNTIRGFTT